VVGGPPAAPKPAPDSKSFMMVSGPFVNPERLPTTASVGGVLILVVMAAIASAASDPPNQPHLLRTVAEVRALTLEQARQKYPIHQFAGSAHPKSTVHRRADLVAHVGQELGLGAAGLTRRAGWLLGIGAPIGECLTPGLAPAIATTSGITTNYTVTAATGPTVKRHDATSGITTLTMSTGTPSIGSIQS
jgi:hypothetical protein